MSCVSEARRAFRVSPQKSALCALQIGFFRFQSLFPDRAQAAQGTCNVLLAYGGTPCRLDNLAERGIIWLQAHKKVQCRSGCWHTRPLQRRSEPPSQPKARRIAFLLYRRNPVLYRGAGGEVGARCPCWRCVWMRNPYAAPFVLPAGGRPRGFCIPQYD